MDLTFLILIIFIGVVLLVIKKAKKRSSISVVPWPFYARRPLSNPEQVLYFRLCTALPEHIVLAQVGLSRILGVKKGNNFGEWYNRINRMSADFVICSRDSTIEAVIELDDASHRNAQRQVADAKKDKALSSAGIRIVRWQAKCIPNEATIKAEFGYAQQSVPSNAPVAASHRQGLV